jgi:hypothetical protein
MTSTTAHPTGAPRTPEPPLLSHLELPCHPTAVARARHHAHAVLGEWRMPDRVVDTAVLLISELATNAVTHAAAQPPGGRPHHRPSCADPHFMLTL